MVARAGARPRGGAGSFTIQAMAKVLIVEDDDVIAQGMARHLEAAGFDPLCVTTARPVSRACASSGRPCASST